MQPLTPRLRLILDVFAGLALIAGALLFFGATRTDAWWSWTIVPPLTAATLGAFYWAAFVLILSAARSRTWARARPAVYPVAVIAVLLLVDHADPPRPVRSEQPLRRLLAVRVRLVPLLLAWALVDQLSGRSEAVRVTHGCLMRFAGCWSSKGVAMVAGGALLLLRPEPPTIVWPWALSPLTSRAIGSFHVRGRSGALIAVRDDDPLSFRGAALAYTALGLLQLLALNLHTPGPRRPTSRHGAVRGVLGRWSS